MAEKPIDLGLTALDELFMTDAQRQENKLPRIRDIPLDQIDDMPNHPYKVRMDEDIQNGTTGLIIGLLLAVVLNLFKDKRARLQSFPMVPYLSAGFLAAYFF